MKPGALMLELDVPDSTGAVSFLDPGVADVGIPSDGAVKSAVVFPKIEEFKGSD